MLIEATPSKRSGNFAHFEMGTDSICMGWVRFLYAMQYIQFCPVYMHCNTSLDGVIVVDTLWYLCSCQFCWHAFFADLGVDSQQWPQPMIGSYEGLQAKQAAFDLGIDIFIHEGIYVCLSGPNYETASESMFLCNIGADAVSISASPEVTVARHIWYQSILGRLYRFVNDYSMLYLQDKQLEQEYCNDIHNNILL